MCWHLHHLPHAVPAPAPEAFAVGAVAVCHHLHHCHQQGYYNGCRPQYHPYRPVKCLQVAATHTTMCEEAATHNVRSPCNKPNNAHACMMAVCTVGMKQARTLFPVRLAAVRLFVAGAVLLELKRVQQQHICTHGGLQRLHCAGHPIACNTPPATYCCIIRHRTRPTRLL